MTKRTLIITTAAAALGLSIWGTGTALSQSAPAEANFGAPIVKAGFGRHGGRHGRRGGGRHGAMMQILRQADANDDGALTQAELDAFVETKVTAADTDSNGEVTLKEFETVWMDLTRRRMVDAFQRLDDDGSGTITAAERAERFGGIVARLDRNDDGKFDRADRGGRRDRGERGHRRRDR